MVCAAVVASAAAASAGAAAAGGGAGARWLQAAALYHNVVVSLGLGTTRKNGAFWSGFDFDSADAQLFLG